MPLHIDVGVLDSGVNRRTEVFDPRCLPRRIQLHEESALLDGVPICINGSKRISGNVRRSIAIGRNYQGGTREVQHQVLPPLQIAVSIVTGNVRRVRTIRSISRGGGQNEQVLPSHGEVDSDFIGNCADLLAPLLGPATVNLDHHRRITSDPHVNGSREINGEPLREVVTGRTKHHRPHHISLPIQLSDHGIKAPSVHVIPDASCAAARDDDVVVRVLHNCPRQVRAGLTRNWDSRACDAVEACRTDPGYAPTGRKHLVDSVGRRTRTRRAEVSGLAQARWFGNARRSTEHAWGAQEALFRCSNRLITIGTERTWHWRGVVCRAIVSSVADSGHHCSRMFACVPLGTFLTLLHLDPSRKFALRARHWQGKPDTAVVPQRTDDSAVRLGSHQSTRTVVSLNANLAVRLPDFVLIVSSFARGRRRAVNGALVADGADGVVRVRDN
eukprot:1882677-Rhodomonas_salina.1